MIVRTDHRHRAVVVELSAYDAHQLGRYLYTEGLPQNDEVWRVGEQLLKASHAVATRPCPDPGDCPLEAVP